MGFLSELRAASVSASNSRPNCAHDQSILVLGEAAATGFHQENWRTYDVIRVAATATRVATNPQCLQSAVNGVTEAPLWYPVHIVGKSCKP